jgi:hypothetical protein
MLLAKEATTPQSQQTFHDLAQSWTRLTAQLEDAQSLLAALNGMEFKDAPENTPSDEADQQNKAA